MRTILNGGTVFDPVVAREIVSNRQPGGGNQLEALSAQGCRILAEMANGKTDKEVAVVLGLTPKTARNWPKSSS